jgi:hypothetical protein
MGAVSVSHLEWRLPSGDELLDDISFTSATVIVSRWSVRTVSVRPHSFD